MAPRKFWFDDSMLAVLFVFSNLFSACASHLTMMPLALYIEHGAVLYMRLESYFPCLVVAVASKCETNAVCKQLF